MHGAHPSGGCWFFDGPAPWDVPLADVPTISEKIVSEALQAIAASGLLGPFRQLTPARAGAAKASANLGRQRSGSPARSHRRFG